MKVTMLNFEEIEKVGQFFYKEVSRRSELDTWNDKYKNKWKSRETNVIIKKDSIENKSQSEGFTDNKYDRTPEQIKRKICNELFK